LIKKVAIEFRGVEDIRLSVLGESSIR